MDQQIQYSCRYTDFTVAPKQRLAELFAAPDLPNDDRESWPQVRLSTCLRSERYSYGPPQEASHPLWPDYAIVGAVPTLARLAAIATGTESVIVGERFISTQVAHAFRASAPDSPLGRLGNAALEIAQEVRDAHSFYALEDYDDIAFELLRRRQRSAKSPHLVIIGSGMLASALCAHRAAENYVGIFMVTRSPKKARKRVARNITVCSAGSLLSVLAGAAFDCIVATTSLTSAYTEVLNSIWSSEHCHSMIDLSSATIIKGHDYDSKFISIYDASFEQAVADANRRLVSLVPAVRCDLAKRVARVAGTLL